MNQHSLTSEKILNQLVHTLSQLNETEYTQPVSLLSGNSIGKHIRHIIEFYECLMNGYISGVVNYDSRIRNPDYENNILSASQVITAINHFFKNSNDKKLTLHSSYQETEFPIESQTSFSRELVYNIEHAIHHMAIIRIAIASEFPSLQLPNDFGIAYSTIKFHGEQCVR